METARVAGAGVTPLLIDVVLPVYNEARVLDASVRALRSRLVEMALPFRVTIVDNASTDATARLALALADEFDDVVLVRLCERGKGRAIAAGWRASDADVLVFMDIDLSADLEHLPALVQPLLVPMSDEGAADVSVGSRYLDGSRVRRGLWRTGVSRAYRAIARAGLRTAVTDPPCGFKAIRRTVSADLLPDVRDMTWFFDTELLVLAERRGYRIREIPIIWNDSATSAVNVVRVALVDLAGIARLRCDRSPGELTLSTRLCCNSGGVGHRNCNANGIGMKCWRRALHRCKRMVMW